jgi:HK97 family phage portal protein
MWNPFKIFTRADPGLEDSSVRLVDTLLETLLRPDAMTLEKAMNIPAFAGCVNLICGTVSLIPIRLYRRGEGDVIEVVQDDPRVRQLNADTGDTLTGANFKKAMVYDYLTSKGGYAYINHRGSSWKGLHFVESTEVSFSEGYDPIFKDYKIMVGGKLYEPFRFLKMCRRTKNGYKGVSVVAENRDLLAAVYNAIILENALVKKGGNKRGFLQSDHKLTQQAVDALRDSFRNLYTSDSDSIPVLNDGVTFQEASATSVELQLNENKRQNSTEICKIFGVPPAILGGGASDRDWLSFVQYCILPILEDLCEACNRDFLLEREKGSLYWAPDVTELTKGDIKTRYEAYNQAIYSGFLQIDEVRAKENLPALGLPFVKLGLQDVLLDPASGDIYTPNTGMWGSLSGQHMEEAPENPEDPDTPPDPPDQEGGGTDEDRNSV